MESLAMKEETITTALQHIPSGKGMALQQSALKALLCTYAEYLRNEKHCRGEQFAAQLNAVGDSLIDRKFDTPARITAAITEVYQQYVKPMDLRQIFSDQFKEDTTCYLPTTEKDIDLTDATCDPTHTAMVAIVLKAALPAFEKSFTVQFLRW